MNHQLGKITLSLCLTLGLVACNSNSGVNSATPIAQTASTSNTSQSVTASQRAQAALAAYHSADASFSDTLRISKQGQFKVQLLGLGSDDDDNDGLLGGLLDGILDGGSSSVNVDANANVDANVDANADGDDNDSSSSVNVGANVDANANLDDDLNAGVDSNTNVNTNVNTTNNSNGSANLDANAGANVGANLDSNSNSGSGNSNGSANLDVGANANVDANLGSNTGTNGSSNSNLNLNTDINADVNATLEAMNRTRSQLRSQIEANGSVRLDGSGGIEEIDENRLHSNVMADLNADADINLDDLSIDFDNFDLDNRADMFTLNGDLMARLQSDNLIARAGTIGSTTNADGSVSTFLAASFDGDGSDRDVLLSKTVNGNAQVGVDLHLREQGNGFDSNGSRFLSKRLDGSLAIMTHLTTELESGDTIEIFEERVTDIQGNGTGTGTLTITGANGERESFDLSTMVAADGSLTTMLDAHDQGSADLMIRENAQGQATLSVLGSNQDEASRTTLDLNTALSSMIHSSFNS